ncbi:peptidoglycan DD-metalloendopeptidase family protein [Streptomyces sp. NPDC005302]|uniref:aggregation-promoting factor C-terminal-like domain-containing protein n=1 Tax=Streptomyces sp. NPDC005302 TaxID=3154675 RepID=UPI0033A34CEA
MAGDLDIVGGAAVDVVPIVPNFHTKLKALVLPIADKVGEEAGKKMGEAISKNIVISIPQAINQGGKAGVTAARRQGDNAGGAFANSIRRKLEAAFKAMPKLDVKLSDTGVDAELARIRAKLEQLSNKRVGVDIDVATAEAEITRLEAQLRELGAQHPNVAVRADTATARAALAQIRAEIASIGGRKTIALEVDGSFGAKLRAVVAEAQASLPDINVDADTTPARAEVQALRERLAALSDVRVGIDIDAATALAEVEAIQTRLEVLSIQHHDIDVRVDAARAAAELAALRAEADSIKVFRIKALADTSGASSALMGLGIQMAALVAIPLGPVLAAGLGAVVSAATAAGAGVGVVALAAIPAIKGVTEAITAKSAAEKEAASATSNAAAANVKASQQALQMAGAQQALTSAHRNAARAIAQANRQISDAERSVAQATQRAADQRRESAESVARAERSLADAQRSAREAEQNLTQARKDAAQQLADLNDQLEQGQLNQRDATLRVKEAAQDLASVQAQYDVGAATDLQLERAQLAYDQSVEAAKQQKKDNDELVKSAAEAKKAGVNGNAEVKRAAEQLADAQRNVLDQTKAVADAQREAARAQVDAAQAVVDAQRGLSDAVASSADAQVQAAESVASAERGVASARLSGIDTTVKAVTKADEYRKALAKLTPEQRSLYDSIAGPKGLTSAFKAWSKELQPDVLPLFTRGVNSAKNSLPGLAPLVKTSADAIGQLMDRAGAQLKTPFWKDFKKDITESAEPAIVGLGVSFGNVFKGIAGIIDAFLPHMDGIAATMERITGRFADWGKNLKGSPEFEHFLQYVKDTSPGLAEFLGDLMKAALDVAQAIAPLSSLMFDVFGPVLDGLSWLSEHAPGVIQILWGLYAVNKAIRIGMAAFAIAMHLYEIAIAGATLVTSGWAVALQATGIVPLIEAIVLGVALLVVGVIYAYKHFTWFRVAVDAAWTGIKFATLLLWEQVLKPTFDAIVIAVKGIGAVSIWLWKNAIKPAWDGISLVLRIVAAIILTAVIAPLIIGFNLMGKWVTWLWKDIFKPAFEDIGAISVWLWKNALQPAFQGIWDLLKWLGDKIAWLYTHIAKPYFQGIGTVATWLWKNGLKPVFSAIWDLLKWLGGKFEWLYIKGVKPQIEAIAIVGNWLYEKALKPAFNKIKDAVALVGLAFELARKAIGKQWSQVSDIAKKPVNFIIEWVYEKGIKAVWDKVASYVGLGPLPKGPKLLEAGGTVGEGWGVARPMKTNRPTAIVGEGDPRYPEYVIPTDPKYRDRALALHRDAGSQLLESGGVLGGAWDWTKDKVSDVVGTGIDWAKTGANLLTNPGDVWSKLMRPILGKVKDGIGPRGAYGKALAKYPTKMVGGLKDKIVNAATSMLFAGEGTGGQWIKPVNVPFGTRFGVSGPMWSSGHHTGLDFPAATGTRVNAVDDGRVTGATSGGPYGNHVTVSHGGGLSSLYAHMSRILTSVGQVVKQGQQIGKVGATGNVTGPHLHLEARNGGRTVDPMKYLTGGGGFAANAVGAAQSYAKSILSNYGWGQGQFGPLKNLWNGESGWRWNADNPTSDAYGIPQALPGSKMASAGSDWRTNYKTQIRWGMDYIKHRPDYGNPAAAYSKWLSRSPHWYDEGGYLPEGLSLVANGTGSPEPVFTGTQWDDIRAAKGGGGSPTVHADVRVYVGDREITDIVRVEVDAREAATAADINTGRWV